MSLRKQVLHFLTIRWQRSLALFLLFVGAFTQFQNCTPVGEAGSQPLPLGSQAAPPTIDKCANLPAPNIEGAMANQTAKSGLGDKSGTSFPQNIPMNASSAHVVKTYAAQAYTLKCSISGVDGIDVRCNSNPDNIDIQAKNTECVSGTATVQVHAQDTVCNKNSNSISFTVAISNVCPAQQQAVNPDPAKNEGFGGDVAIDGTRSVVLAPKDSEIFSKNGAAYVYELINNVWTKTQKLLPVPLNGDQLDILSKSVAVSGNYIVVGAPWYKNHGAAFVYFYDGTNWAHVGTLLPSPVNANVQYPTYFGYDVAIEGLKVYVGAPGYDANGKAAAGEVQEFDITGVVNGGLTYNGPFEIKASDGAAGDYFGTSVAVSGSRLAVGAPGNTEYGLDGISGKAYAFLNSVETKLSAGSDIGSASQYGYSIGISGERVIVGAIGANAGKGSVFFFNLNGAASGATATRTQVITGSDAGPGELFASTVAISGNNVSVGAPAHSIGNLNFNGTTYYYRYVAGSNFVQKYILFPRMANRASDDRFGESVAISGDYLITGSRLNDLGSDINAGMAFWIKHTEIQN